MVTSRADVEERRPYVSIVYRAGRAGYAVAFPDVPGCTASGRTVDHAMPCATRAMRSTATLPTLGKPVDRSHRHGISTPSS